MNAHDLFVLKEEKKNIKAKRCSAFMQTNSFPSPAAVYEITFTNDKQYRLLVVGILGFCYWYYYVCICIIQIAIY